MAKIIKEIIIMLLVCLVAMLILAIVLYKFIPSKKIVPEITTYEVSEQVQDLLDDNIDSREKDSKVLATYEVTKSDLSGYQKSNDYIPGKANPFADVSKTITDDSQNGGSSGGGSSNVEKPSSDGNTNEETPKVTPSNPSVYEEGGKK